MHPKYHFCLRSLAAAASLYVAAVAAQEPADDRIHGEDHEHDVLEEVRVTASAIPREALELSQSATVLRGEALADVVNNNIGDTLSTLPGLSNASFGENVGRPVIRGLQGGRVGVLNDGMTSFDASAVSQDHAVPTEPFLADQVEVLRGPTTLLYGSGAIGGVVNMVTNTIPLELPEDGASGRALVQGDSAADQRFGVARLDFGIDDFAFHVNGFVRRTDNYEIPGAADLYPDDDHDDHEDDHHDEHEEAHDHEDEHDEEVAGVLDNSFLDNEGGAVGIAWINDDWRVGASWTDYDSHYGIPGAHSHHHEDGHDHEGEHDEHDEHEDDHHEDGHEDEDVTIRLESQRADAIATKSDPFSGFSRFTLKTAITNYTHTEFEGEEVGTVFDSDTIDARLELEHAPWGDWVGTFGGQWSDNDFHAEGAEAFVPPSESRTAALFWVESAEFEHWTLDLGLRYEDTSIDSFLIEHDHDHGHEDDHEDDHDDGHHDDEHGDEHMEPVSRDFQPFSASIGAIWHMTGSSHLAFNFAHAERAPASEELFASGPHIATQVYEVGDPDLGTETNTHYELSWRLHQGPLMAMITMYYDDFDDYIYLADAGEEFDGLPEFLWSQQDAEFSGGELELRWDMGDFSTGHWQVFGFYDRVKATLADGSPVPRIPPQRFGLGLDWDHGAWAGGLNWVHAVEHDRVAAEETITPGYDLLNAELSWALPFGDRVETVVFLQGRNLLDEDVRNSTSFLKDQAPQIGRNWVLGLKAAF